MKNLFLLSIVLVLIFFSCQAPMQEERVQSIIDSTRADFAPDKRIALFDIYWEKGTLAGETNLPEAHQALLQKLAADNLPFKDSITLLPESGLGEATFALVTNSVANIRSEPKHSAELATQALMGTPLNILKESGSWYLVQTPDDYISWVDAAAIVPIDQKSLDDWMGKEKVVVTEMIGNVYTDKNQEGIVSDITAGNVLEIVERFPQGYQVVLPDGRTGFIAADMAVPYEDWINSRSTDDTSLVQTAKRMMGSPYLWGGTSPKGMDCSGFTKTIYFLNGMVIPRDASQQILEGELIDSDKNWKNLEIGDLLFFGVPATENSRERVVHVGMWIGDNQFIHSRGRVRISSFDPNDENYDAYELGRYLRTKRIRQNPTERIVSVNQILN
ncbi:C40 family peptidase [Cyclobacterium salsum]|uniref:C40 family peptidase n=1 Tax=Cyclobacterium salsum TaxID=2666329 RepID=UPI0013913BF7|nr:C40 family peptidase [Cyclobacterium salsum]